MRQLRPSNSNRRVGGSKRSERASKINELTKWMNTLGSPTFLKPATTTAECSAQPHLLVLTEIRRASGEPRRRQLQRDRDRIAARIPVFRGFRDHAKYTDIGVGRTFRPPRLRFDAPQFPDLGDIAQHLGAPGEAEVSIRTGVGESKAHVRRSTDFFVLGPALVGDEPQATGLTIRHRMHRS